MDYPLQRVVLTVIVICVVLRVQLGKGYCMSIARSAARILGK